MMHGQAIVEHPRRGPRRAGALAALAVALLAAAVAAALLARRLSLDPGYAARVVGVLTLGALLAWSWLRDGGEGVRFGAANQVTLVRAVLVALVLALAASPENAAVAGAAAMLAATAAGLDGVDGWIARRTGTTSRFGARFDMETDALLILSLSLLAWQWHKAGAWVLAAGLARYAFVAAARVAPWLGRALPASRRRQAVCVVQTAALIACVSPLLSAPASAVVAAGGLAALAVSFALDVAWLRRAARPAGITWRTTP